MSGIISSFHGKPIFFKRNCSAVKQPFFLLPLSSFDSSLFGIRLRRDCNIVALSRRGSSACLNRVTVVNARYGGRGSYAETSQSRQGDFGGEDALDISSVRSAHVRLLDDQQNMVGIVSKAEALQMAEERELDLVVVAPDSDPPVVKIMDLSKYKYELQKKKRVSQKKSSATRTVVKELKMGWILEAVAG